MFFFLTYLTMKGKQKEMISMYLIIMIILITFGVLLFVKPKPKQQSIDSIDNYNDIIKKYNEIINMINIEIIKKRWTIVHANDIAAMNALNKCIENINYLSDTIANYCNRFSDACKNHDMGGANYCLINIRENLVSLSIDLKTIKDIKVSCFTNSNSTKEQPVVKETIVNTVSYFEGCKTKEELDTRYRALAKVFHPDAKSGDETIFVNIQNEYERLTNGGN